MLESLPNTASELRLIAEAQCSTLVANDNLPVTGAWATWFMHLMIFAAQTDCACDAALYLYRPTGLQAVQGELSTF